MSDWVSVNGKRVQMVRELRGMSPAQLAKQVDVSTAQIDDIEDGRCPVEPWLFDRLVLVLGFPPAFFRLGDPVPMTVVHWSFAPDPVEVE